MATNHLKRINAPKTWPIERKQSVFIMRPNAGGQKMERGVTVSLFCKELVNVAKSSRGVRLILNQQEILVNGKRKYDPADLIGLFDIVSFPGTKSSYRLTINRLNRLQAIPVAASDAQLIISKITAKTLLKGGKTQLSFHNGRTLLVAKGDYKVGETLLLSAENKEQGHFLIEKGATVFVTGGRHVGETGTVEAIDGETITIKHAKSTVQTEKEHVFAIGKEKAAVKIE